MIFPLFPDRLSAILQTCCRYLYGGVLLLPLFLPDSASAAAFTRKAGTKFISSVISRYQTARMWDPDGHRKPSGNRFRKLEFDNYLEAGITDDDLLFAKVLYDRIDESLHGRTWGFYDPEFGWRHRFYQEGSKSAATQVTAIIPAGSAGKPALRYGRAGGELMLSFGQSLDNKSFPTLLKRPFFYDIGIGYRFFEGFPGNQLRGELTLGKTLSPRIELYLSSHLEYGLWDGSPLAAGSSVLQEANYRLLKLSLLMRARISKDASLIVGYTKHIWGRNTGTGGGPYIGCWMDL